MYKAVSKRFFVRFSCQWATKKIYKHTPKIDKVPRFISLYNHRKPGYGRMSIAVVKC